MATIVCQGLQSCLESPHVNEPRTLRLKLSSSKPQLFPHHRPFELTFNSCFFNSTTKQEFDDEEKCQYEEEIISRDDSDSLDDDKHGSSNAADSSSLSFFEALSNGSQLISSKSETTTDKQNTYVQPKVKRSLSDKSLELCTENLGSETGTDIFNKDNIFPLPNSSSSSDESYGGDFPTREQRSHQLFGAKKANTSTGSRSRSFPPPLTSITGFESLQVRPHREDGRLIIKAIKAPSTHSLFQAERSHGRLRLFLYEDNSTPFFDSEEDAADESNADNIEGCNEEDEIKNDANCAEDEANLEEHEDGGGGDDDDDEEKLENDASNLGEEINGNRKDDGGEMGMKDFQRPGRGRCKEGETTENKGLLSWEAFWVATS